MIFKFLVCALALLVQSISGNFPDDAVVIIEDDCYCGNSNSSSGTVTGINIDSVGSNRASNIGSSSNCGSSSNYGSYSIINNPRCTSSVTGSLSTSGGPFLITSTGPVIPSGIIINSNNNLAGDLTVAGQLPFLTAVRFEGSFPSNGMASVSYGCGDGNISIQEVIGGSSGSSASPTLPGASLPPGSVGFPSASLASGSSGYPGFFGSSGCKC